MKHLYTALACLMICSSAATAGTRFAARRAAQRHTIAKEATNPDLIWRPASQTDFLYMDGEWLELGTTTFSYDERGNATLQDIEDEDGNYRIATTFDQYNQPLERIETASEDGTVWANESRTVYTYDPILHSYYTERAAYDWADDSWVKNYKCETNVITRDGGKIVEIVKSLPMTGEDLVPAYKLLWNYNESTGQADAMTYYVNNYTNSVIDWEVYDDTEYRNIVWEATDGQMTEASISDYLEGANRISRADVYYEGVIDGHLFVTYTADGGYTVRDTYADPDKAGVVVVKAITDANGSYTTTETEYFDEDGEYSEEPTGQYVSTVTFNEKGDLVSEEVTETYDGITELVDGIKYEYTYDAAGHISQYVMSQYNYDDAEYAPAEKATFGEYKSFAGIEDVAVDADAPATYYDLQGRAVANPAPGRLYIKRQGNKATKVVL